MKIKFAIILLLMWSFWLVAGCNNQSGQPSAGKVMLPPDIAGIWQAKDSLWKIVLSPDGTVSSVTVPMGGAEIKPNKITKMEMRDGSISTYKAGDCIAQYAPDKRELYVSVEIKDIHIIFAGEVIDGNSIDRFVGTVSEDGKVWTADWITKFDYGPRFPQGDPFPQQLILEKVEEQTK